jgi:cobalt-precorrin 5A hydrolase/precorrin-3B C17-methyltransferase
VKRRLGQLEGYVAEGDVFGVEWAAAEGRFPTLVNENGWPAPVGFRFGIAPERVVITDELGDFAPGTAYLRPPSLIAGIHPRPSATEDEIEALLVDTLAGAGLARSSVYAIATADYTRNDKCLRRLGYPIRSYRAPVLDRVRVPNPSESLRSIVGSRSVCEAAALRTAGASGHLVVERTRSPHGTIAIARRVPPGEVIIDATGTASAIARRAVR